MCTNLKMVGKKIRHVTIIGLVAILQLVAGSVTSLPTLPIESGYGANGTFKVSVDSVPNPHLRNHFIYLFYPSELKGPIPVFFFCHGIGAENPLVYNQLIRHCVSRGYAVLYSPFNKRTAVKSPNKTYKTIWDGFTTGVKSWGPKLDTSRIGFIGHSYGAGAVPAFTYRALNEKGWGRNGAFMYMMAPWYSFEISQEQLSNFPLNVKLIMEIFDADRINDHRMAADIFRSISIPSNEKDFITIESDTCDKDLLVAGHGVPEGVYPFGWDVNALDYYGVYRLIDALAEYTFTKNERAKAIALGNGSDEQRYMGVWKSGEKIKPLSVTDTPCVKQPQAIFVNFWNHAINPRAKIERYFGTSSSKSVSSSVTIRNYKEHFIYPKKLKRKTEAYLEDQGIIHNNNSYKDDGDHNAQVPDSINDKKIWPIKPIVNGFGAKGNYQVQESFFRHPIGGRDNLYCFLPVNYNGRMPVLLFAPKLNSDGKKYRQLLTHLASQGYLVISSIYRYGVFSGDTKRYEALLSGFESVLEIKKQYIDTTRIGFLGHAYGAGALPAISWYYLKKKNWGSNGAFLFLMSPSYVHLFTDEQFASFPPWVNFTIEVYDKDHFDDHRIAEDIFYSVNIHPSKKEFLYVRSCTHSSFSFDADFQLPECKDEENITPMQQYAIFRQCDALAASTFAHDSNAVQIAMGNGSSKQIYMGTWWDNTPVRSLISTDVPVFRNLKWVKPIVFLGMPSLINAVWPVALLCGFNDRRNERRDKFVP